MTTAYLNQVATAVPAHDVHRAFVELGRTQLADPRHQPVFDRLASRAQIEHRYSVVPAPKEFHTPSDDAAALYAPGRYPSTHERMQLFEQHAPALAVAAVRNLGLGGAARTISHVIVTSCTGMYAPGLDIDIVTQCGIPTSAERTMVGFMGCSAAVNALKLARHIVRSDPAARVLLVNVELCSLHLQDTHALEPMLAFLVFGDGCAASIVSAEPTGLALDRFLTVLIPGTRDLITWKVGDAGFDMHLSGRVPATIAQGLELLADDILDGVAAAEIDLWAVHPGGRSVLDAVQRGLRLEAEALAASREVLADYGNMSSATIMFVLAKVLAAGDRGGRGCAMSFGPGLTAETMLFHHT